MMAKRNSKAPQRFEDSIHSINNSKTNKKTTSKKKSDSKNNLEVCDNDTEKDMKSNGSKGSDKDMESIGSLGFGRDGCVGNSDVRESSDELSKDMQNDDARMDSIENEANTVQKSYANMVKNDEVPKSLNYIPTLITDSGNEVVIFDEALIQYKKDVGKFGISEIDAHKNGQYVFKFKDNAGLNVVLEKGPWMVKNKPLFVTRWNAELGMEKLEPKCFPVWVKMVNAPLEAWTVEGISALASSLGKPMIMDSNTANLCHKGIGNFDFARVLVEMNAYKEFKKEIVIQYRDKNNNVKGNKTVKVAYDWKPPSCDHCKVFGHVTTLCKKGGAIFDMGDLKTKENPEEGKEELNNGNHEELRKEINQEYRSNSSIRNNAGKFQGARSNQSSQKEGDESKVQKNKWNVKEKVVEEIRKSANKFSILNTLPEDDDHEIRILKGRMIVDEFLNKKMQPNLIESMTWSKDMINYFKEKWESDRQKYINKEIKVVELDDTSTPANGIWNFMERNEVIGMEGNILDDDAYGV
ncbi:ATPase, F1/V1/A1 complex, alpha/beta subunit [Tanacetum coccineum]